jgi:predicted transcriptional regulator
VAATIEVDDDISELLDYLVEVTKDDRNRVMRVALISLAMEIDHQLREGKN